MNLDTYKEQFNLSDQDVKKIIEAKSKVKFNPISLGVTVVGIVLTLASKMYVLGIPFVILPVVIELIMYSKKLSQYKNTVKEILVRKMFEREFDHVTYSPTQGFEQKFIDDTEMYDKGNTYSSNDLLSASYKGIGFMQADVCIQNVTSNGKTTTTTTYFRGRWFVCDFIKNFDGYHQIRSNGSFFANKKPRKFFGTKTKQIDFESVEFNKKFSCYTNDEREAFYLITPDYMEKMAAFRDFVNCEVVYGFINNKLHIAIYNNHNAFEMSSRMITDEFINSVKYDIRLIKDVIDGLELHTDLFK